MACHDCLTHTNPDPCCPHERNFGQTSDPRDSLPFGYGLAHPVDPPWFQSLALAAIALYGSALRAGPADGSRWLGTPLMVAGPAFTALLWYRYKNPVM